MKRQNEKEKEEQTSSPTKVKKTSEEIWTTTKEVEMFGSCIREPFRKLSNFYDAPIKVDEKAATQLHLAIPDLFPSVESALGLEFPTSEHLWQCLKCSNLKDVQRFTKSGDFGQRVTTDQKEFSALMKRMCGKDGKYWLERHCIGVIPKMVVNPTRAEKVLGLVLSPHRRLDTDFTNKEVEKMIWMQILRLKYEQNEECRMVLIGSGGQKKEKKKPGDVDDDDELLLVEFDRHGGYWGAHCLADGKRWCGHNAMGKYLMEIRKQLSHHEPSKAEASSSTSLPIP